MVLACTLQVLFVQVVIIENPNEFVLSSQDVHQAAVRTLVVTHAECNIWVILCLQKTSVFCESNFGKKKNKERKSIDAIGHAIIIIVDKVKLLPQSHIQIQ